MNVPTLREWLLGSHMIINVVQGRQALFELVICNVPEQQLLSDAEAMAEPIRCTLVINRNHGKDEPLRFSGRGADEVSAFRAAYLAAAANTEAAWVNHSLFEEFAPGGSL